MNLISCAAVGKFLNFFYLLISPTVKIGILIITTGDSPAGSVVKTPHFHCRGPRFNTWSGN